MDNLSNIRRLHLAPALLGALVALLLFTYYRTAWLGDDSYITFRSVDNLVNGYGPRWNVSERVQAFTNPLWMFALAVPYALTREMYLTPILFSMAVSMAAVITLLFGVARTYSAAIFAAAAMLFSRAFIDYSSSGLENPLTHLLLGLFLWQFLQSLHSRRALLVMALVGGLLPVNRLDTVLLVAPPLLYLFLSTQGRDRLFVLLLAAGPTVLWEIFSLVYYGFPFPNTAYAKLGTGTSDLEMAERGIGYFLSSLKRDPLTVPVIFTGLLAAFWTRDAKRMFAAAGVCLYLLYIIKVGGDFMGGRFFSAPFYISLCLLVTLAARERIISWSALAVAAAFIGSLAPFIPITTGAEHQKEMKGKEYVRDRYEVGDERRVYFAYTGLIHWRPGMVMPTHEQVEQAKAFAAVKDRVRQHHMVGFRGFFAGPEVHIIDIFALADPLLARLPARFTPHWRIGHFRRAVPEGYERTLETGKSQFVDKKLGEYYEKLRLIVSGPLFSADRWKALVAMNLGQYDHLIDWKRYRFPDEFAKKKLAKPAQERAVKPAKKSGRPNEFKPREQKKGVKPPEYSLPNSGIQKGKGN